MTQIFLQAANGGGGWGFLLMMVVLFGIMYFLMIRPQQKQQKKTREFQNALEAGMDVITNGGIYGRIKNVDYATGRVSLEVSTGVVITVDKNYIFATQKDVPQR